MFDGIFRSRPGQGRRSDQDRGRGRGGGSKPGAGPGGNCVCPKCGFKKTHEIGTRCMDIKCPQCGAQMTRE